MRLIATLVLTIMFFVSPVFEPSGTYGESPPSAVEKTTPEMPLIKEAGELYSGRFPLKKVGSHYVSVRHKDKAGQPIEEALDAITIPGTEITAGVFRYEYINERGEEDFIRKSGALINDSIYYVESSDKKAWGSYDIGDPFILIYKDYFTLDACTFGASACRNKMFLFKYTKDSVEILDCIESTYFEFHTETDLNDIDNDGNPELKVSISYNSIKTPIVFNLFLEIRDNRILVDFNPELYKPLFKEIERKYRKKTDKPDAYYFYGFLSGKLSLKRIQAMLAGKKDPGKKEPYIIKILKKRDRWDADFHDNYSDRPVLIRHNLKQKTGGK